MKLQHRFFAIVCALMLSPAAHAGLITWDPATNTLSSTDVSTTGTLVQAANVGGGAVTVNGVTFDPTDVGGADFGSALTANSGSSSYNGLLTTFEYSILPQSISVGNGLLQLANDYLLQVWWTDTRGTGRVFEYGDGNGNTVALNSLGGGFGQYAIGTFSATGQNQTLNIIPNPPGHVDGSSAHINAFQIRLVAAAVPEPPTIALLALGLLGVGFARKRRDH